MNNPHDDAALTAFYDQCFERFAVLQAQREAAQRAEELEHTRLTEMQRQALLPALPSVLHPYAKLETDRSGIHNFLVVSLPNAAPFRVAVHSNNDIKSIELAGIRFDGETRKPYWSLFDSTFYHSPDLAEIVMLALERGEEFDEAMTEWVKAQLQQAASQPVEQAIEIEPPTDAQILESLINEIALKAANIAINQHVSHYHSEA